MTELAVTIPKAAADEAKRLLAAWNGINGARIIGETDDELGLSVNLLTTPISAVGMRLELEKRLRPIGGRIGAREEWLIAQSKLKPLS